MITNTPDYRSSHRTLTIHFKRIFSVISTIILIASFAAAYTSLLWVAFTE